MTLQTEFYLLMKRYLKRSFRLPIGLFALLGMAATNSFMIASVFGGVGSQNIKTPVPDWWIGYDANDPDFTAHNQRVGMNWIGAINFVATDAFISMSMAMVMIVPELRPVYERERANRMYSAATQYLVVQFAGMLVFAIYPVITATLSFHYLKIADQSWENFAHWLTIAMLQSFAGMSFGFMIGTLFHGSTAPNWCQGGFTILNFGSGLWVHNKTTNVIIKSIGWASPFRYATEALLRVLLVDKMYADKVLEQFDYNVGTDVCKA